MSVLTPKTFYRILDFDIENRPISYLGSDFTTADITAIACSWVGEKKVHCWMLGEVDYVEMLTEFTKFFREADVVTGHYIRQHDLPIISGALFEFNLPKLGRKLTSDTKTDLRIMGGISKSQESLAGVLDLPGSKYHMTQDMWRDANRLTPTGIELTRKRVCDDVVQHKHLREVLVRRNMLNPPVLWRS